MDETEIRTYIIDVLIDKINIYSSLSFENVNENNFVRDIFHYSQLDKQFWLDTKKWFVGNHFLIEFLNPKNNNLFTYCNILTYTFNTREKLPVKTVSKQLESINNIYLNNGLIIEDFIINYFNKIFTRFKFVSSGRICLKEIPIFGATPDALVFDKKNSYPNATSSDEIVEIKSIYVPKYEPKNNNDISEYLLHILLKNFFVISYVEKCKKRRTVPLWLFESFENFETYIRVIFDSMRIFYIDLIKQKEVDITDSATVFPNLTGNQHMRQLLSECVCLANINDFRHSTIKANLLYVFYSGQLHQENPIHSMLGCINIKFKFCSAHLQSFNERIIHKFNSLFLKLLKRFKFKKDGKDNDCTENCLS